jgi:hypothetical protein
VDAAHLETRAESNRLTGEKPLPFASIADASRSLRSTTVGLCRRARSARARITALSGNDMTRRVDRMRLSATPATRIGSVREAIDRTRDAGLILLAADAWAGARRCHHMTTEYAKTRVQFGQPIGSFQGIKHQLADLIADLEPALSLWWYAAHAFDRMPEASARPAAPRPPRRSSTRAARTSIERTAASVHLGVRPAAWFRRAMFDRAFLGVASYHRRRAADLAGW